MGGPPVRFRARLFIQRNSKPKGSSMTANHILDAHANDAATINGWSDRNPATIVKRTAKTIWVQRDNTAQMSGADHDAYAHGRGEVVVFVRDYDARIERYSL